MDIKEVLENGAYEIDDSSYGAPDEIREESITCGDNNSMEVRNIMEQLLDEKVVVSVMREIAQTLSNDEGWVDVADVNRALIKRIPNFDQINYGHRHFHKFIKANDEFIELKEVIGADSNVIRYFMKFRK